MDSFPGHYQTAKPNLFSSTHALPSSITLKKQKHDHIPSHPLQQRLHTLPANLLALEYNCSRADVGGGVVPDGRLGSRMLQAPWVG